jgi:mono/diheme cytochrome c family protein
MTKFNKNNHIPFASILIFLNIIFIDYLHALPFNQEMVGTQLSTGDIQRLEPTDSIPRGYLARDLVKKREDALLIPNPVKPTRNSIRHGQRLYNANCSVCHGRLIEDKLVKGVMQDLNGALPLFAEFMKPKPDGHFYQHIYFGLMPIMPSYKYRFTEEEQWDLVNFIRHGQSVYQGEMPQK